MSYTAHHRSHHDACSLEARGSGVRASRDPQAATSGQATTTTHTPDHHRGAYPPEPGQTRIGPPDLRPALALRTLLACPTSSPSPADVATRGRANDALAWHRAYTPPTATPSGGRATTWFLWDSRCEGEQQGTHRAGRARAFRDRSTRARWGLAPPPDPRFHHDGLPTQRFITRRRSR
jgi:hypothetical protein